MKKLLLTLFLALSTVAVSNVASATGCACLADTGPPFYSCWYTLCDAAGWTYTGTVLQGPAAGHCTLAYLVNGTWFYEDVGRGASVSDLTSYSNAGAASYAMCGASGTMALYSGTGYSGSHQTIPASSGWVSISVAQFKSVAKSQ